MTPGLSTSAGATLPDAEWLHRRAVHEARVRPWVEPRLQRRSRGEAHPVEDFLFEYYRFTPGELRRWHPGLGVELIGASAQADYAGQRHYVETEHGVRVSSAGLSASRRDGLRWIRVLLEQSAARPAFFGCAGLHEWAMVYRSPEIRHASWPLRLSETELAAFVESQPVCCTHFDAFRFFTEPARPLNRLQPTRATQPALEQPGCLHANMDLYKWLWRTGADL